MSARRYTGIALALALGLASGARAEREASQGPQDPRVRTVLYNPRDVVKIEATYGYHTVVEFGAGEVIESVLIGDSMAWDVQKSDGGNRIFLKPKENRASTNLTVITDRHTYTFGLEAARSTAKNRMTWLLRFDYPVEDAVREERVALQRAAFVNPDAPARSGKLNFEYSYGGKETFRPDRMFDDGEFTYFKFAGRQDLPAIFIVDEEKNEALVNSRVSGEYVVVHRVAKQFALRSGDALTCIFNDGFETRAGKPVNAPRRAGERKSVEVEPGTTASTSGEVKP
jgi:type IV secretion system protein VirB9